MGSLPEGARRTANSPTQMAATCPARVGEGTAPTLDAAASRPKMTDAAKGGSKTQRAVISYQGGELEAWEQEDLWTVRLGELEASSRYLDIALAELLDDPEGAHRLAAGLLAELVTAPDTTETAEPAALPRNS